MKGRRRTYNYTRIFGSKEYGYTGTRQKKSLANKDAKRWRKQGFNVRIVKIKQGDKTFYNLYSREKRRK